METGQVGWDFLRRWVLALDVGFDVGVGVDWPQATRSKALKANRKIQRNTVFTRRSIVRATKKDNF